MHIAHVGVWTRDLDAAAVFWRDYFGAAVGEQYESKRRAGFISRFVSLGTGAKIELMSGPWIENAQLGDRVGGHVALSLGSEAAVDALARRCTEAGMLVSAPRTTGDGFYEAVVKTPDGTLIEITS